MQQTTQVWRADEAELSVNGDWYFSAGWRVRARATSNATAHDRDRVLATSNATAGDYLYRGQARRPEQIFGSIQQSNQNLEYLVCTRLRFF